MVEDDRRVEDTTRRHGAPTLPSLPSSRPTRTLALAALVGVLLAGCAAQGSGPGPSPSAQRTFAPLPVGSPTPEPPRIDLAITGPVVIVEELGLAVPLPEGWRPIAPSEYETLFAAPDGARDPFFPVIDGLVSSSVGYSAFGELTFVHISVTDGPPDVPISRREDQITGWAGSLDDVARADVQTPAGAGTTVHIVPHYDEETQLGRSLRSQWTGLFVPVGDRVLVIESFAALADARHQDLIGDIAGAMRQARTDEATTPAASRTGVIPGSDIRFTYPRSHVGNRPDVLAAFLERMRSDMGTKDREAADATLERIRRGAIEWMLVDLNGTDRTVRLSRASGAGVAESIVTDTLETFAARHRPTDVGEVQDPDARIIRIIAGLEDAVSVTYVVELAPDLVTLLIADLGPGDLTDQIVGPLDELARSIRREA